MNELELIYDHYKETDELSKKAIYRRNKNFVVLCVLEGLLFLILIKPEYAFGLICQGINDKLEMTLQLSNAIIQTLIWLLIVYVLIRYIQDVLYVERQYEYLEKLEKVIAELSSQNVFSREGENYQRDYPMVLNFIDLFYKMFMPIFFGVINAIRIYKEWTVAKGITLALGCDTILCVAMLVVDWFYFFEIHYKITTFCKVHIPFVGTLAKNLRKILKEV